MPTQRNTSLQNTLCHKLLCRPHLIISVNSYKSPSCEPSQANSELGERTECNGRQQAQSEADSLLSLALWQQGTDHLSLNSLLAETFLSVSSYRHLKTALPAREGGKGKVCA